MKMPRIVPDGEPVMMKNIYRSGGFLHKDGLYVNWEMWEEYERRRDREDLNEMDWDTLVQPVKIVWEDQE